jgi:predicted kinase
MTTLIAMRGLPGSGKSTRARQMLDDVAVGTLVRTSRDVYRVMLHGHARHGDRVCEDQVTIAQHASIRALLLAGVDVIVDDTNLSLRNLSSLLTIACQCGADFRVEDLTDVPLELCIARDGERDEPHRVGEQIIKWMHGVHLAGRPPLNALKPSWSVSSPLESLAGLD